MNEWLFEAMNELHVVCSVCVCVCVRACVCVCDDEDVSCAS
jgi:hypothetical protein